MILCDLSPAFTPLPLLLLLINTCYSHTGLLSTAPAGHGVPTSKFLCSNIPLPGTLLPGLSICWPDYRSGFCLNVTFREKPSWIILKCTPAHWPVLFSSQHSYLKLCVGLLSVSLPPPQLECKFYKSSNLDWFTAITLVSRTMPTHRG